MSTKRVKALLAFLPLFFIPLFSDHATAQGYQYTDTGELVKLVKDAADLVRTKGDAAFTEFRSTGSRWRRDETYIFVLDQDGKMLVHPDQAMEGKNQMDLKDINGKPIIRGLIDAVSVPGKMDGWYHYQWPVPGGLLPRWKSSYVQLAKAPSGTSYVVGSGAYNDRMEKAFVVDLVTNAVGLIEKNGKASFDAFHDPKGLYMAKDAYIFVITMDGLELVNPGFRNLEGRSVLDLKDTEGKMLVREMLKVVKEQGSGWVDYMWPKPGDSVSTLKSTYVTKARMGDQWVMVGSGVYLAYAPTDVRAANDVSATQLMKLVRDAAAVLKKDGEKAYPEFRQKGTKWLRDNTYIFVYGTDGIRAFNAADPTLEGKNVSSTEDVLGRPYGKMFLEAAASPSGEGWVHYMYPEPGNIFPAWKSTFLKSVTFPSGQKYLVGAGVYNMQTGKPLIEDVVNRAAAMIADRGPKAFDHLRDKKGPFVFMDTYVFVDKPDGTELVNSAQPSLEGSNLIDVKDLTGKYLVRNYINAAMKDGTAWVDYFWYKPGHNEPARKQSYVKKVQYKGETYIVGSGFYPDDEEK
jgi:signal transduction histidine kinase